jgi:hypothetical protein
MEESASMIGSVDDRHEYANAILGVSDDPDRVVYSYDDLIQEFMRVMDVDYDEAQEWVDFNVVRGLGYSENPPDSGVLDMKPYYEDNLCKIYNTHCGLLDDTSGFDVVVMDPPFQDWGTSPVFFGETTFCFTNPQNRRFVDERFGAPRCEVVWFFRDGRWVSHRLPRITHEYIYVYGKTGNAYVGDKNDLKPCKKGRGCVGSDRLEERTYVPRERRQLNSVMEFPRTGGDIGVWTKPLELMVRLVEWAGGDTLFDPYCGSGTSLVAASRFGMRCVGVEIDEECCEIAAKRLSQAVLDFG